uniref:Putative arylformamidase n=1 Tax=Lygus hesperus TaxID=30085 RepID=A0A0A9XV71_LYGHE
MTQEFNENQYWPHKWSKRLPEDTICVKHLELAHEETNKNKKSILSEENVQYGNSETEVMDVYGKDLPPNAPWFVYIRGGYWIKYNKEHSAYGALPLWRAGIRVCVPEYDLAPKVKMTEIVNQMQTMANFVLRKAVEEGSKGVWICGHSAGAQLAARLLDENWLKTLNSECRNMFKGLMMISGVYDLMPILNLRDVNDLLKMDEEEAKAQSPINTVTNFKAKELLSPKFKTTVIVAGDESKAFIQQSENYCKILNQSGNEAEYLLLPDHDHFDIVENLRNDSYILTQKFVKEITG